MGGIMGIMGPLFLNGLGLGAQGGLSDGWHHGHDGAFVSERLGLRGPRGPKRWVASWASWGLCF